MVKFTHYIGFDVSGSLLHLSLLNADGQVLSYKEFSNEKERVLKVVRGLVKKFKLVPEALFCCVESTGRFDRAASEALYQMGIALGVEPWNRIKSVLHRRGKTDRTDSARIADHARVNHQRIRRWRPRSVVGEELQDLVRFRESLLKSKRADRCRLRAFSSTQTGSKFVNKMLRAKLKQIDKQLAKVEVEIGTVIKSSPLFQRQMRLLLSIPGIGKVTAWYLLSITDGFSRFDSARQLASYAGVVPYQNESGSSVRRRSVVSKMSNKALKKVLHMAALSASLKTKKPNDLKAYYHRKAGQGTNPMSVLNAVRGKLLHIAFAVINRGTPYAPVQAAPALAGN